MPISARAGAAQDVIGAVDVRRLIPYRGDREDRQASPGTRRAQWSSIVPGGTASSDCRSGRLGLELAQDVEGALADLASDSERGGVRAGVAAGAQIQIVVGAVLAAGMLSRFDQSPAQARRSLLGELPSPFAISRIPHDRIEPGNTHDLAGPAKALGVADLGQNGGGEDRSDPEDLAQRPESLVGLRQSTQLTVDHL